VLSSKIELLAAKLDLIDARVAALEAQPTGSSGLINVADMFAAVGLAFDSGVTTVKELVAETFTVGTPEKPTGITLYDEETGEPYCFSIRGGRETVRPGDCSEPAEPSTPPSDPIEGELGGSAPAPVPGPAPAPDPAPEPAPAPEPLAVPEPPPAPEPEPAA
jgi:hypothetical protein